MARHVIVSGGELVFWRGARSTCHIIWCFYHERPVLTGALDGPSGGQRVRANFASCRPRAPKDTDTDDVDRLNVVSKGCINEISLASKLRSAGSGKSRGYARSGSGGAIHLIPPPPSRLFTPSYGNEKPPSVRR